MSDMRVLALAVLAQAIKDISNTCKTAEDGINHSEARAFLSAPAGNWAASRQAWCEMADIDEYAVVRRALEILK